MDENNYSVTVKITIFLQKEITTISNGKVVSFILLDIIIKGLQGPGCSVGRKVFPGLFRYIGVVTWSRESSPLRLSLHERHLWSRSICFRERSKYVKDPSKQSLGELNVQEEINSEYVLAYTKQRPFLNSLPKFRENPGTERYTRNHSKKSWHFTHPLSQVLNLSFQVYSRRLHGVLMG